MFICIYTPKTKQRWLSIKLPATAGLTTPSQKIYFIRVIASK